MGVAFQNYCYETELQAVTAFNSVPDRLSIGSGYVNFRAVTDGAASIQAYFYSAPGAAPVASSTGFGLPVCDPVGPLNPLMFGVDWSIVEWIFGAGLILFATGAGVGAVINVVRKARFL